jgi:hypothetical protein
VIKQGDVVGLLLDLGQRTLSVYLNGARRGVMVAPGMKNERGEAVAPLAGPLRWVVDVQYGWASSAGRRQGRCQAQRRWRRRSRGLSRRL